MSPDPDTEFPAQTQERPGHEGEMSPEPHDEMRGYAGSDKLEGRVALITGGDSGIGRAVAIAFPKEGADVAIAYLSEDDDARHTVGLVEAEGRRAVAIRGDLTQEERCVAAVQDTVDKLGHLDVLVNHIAYQAPGVAFEDITSEQWDLTFKTNLYSFFWTTKVALAYLPTAPRSSTPARSTACAATSRSSTTRRRRARSSRSPTRPPRRSPSGGSA